MAILDKKAFIEKLPEGLNFMIVPKTIKKKHNRAYTYTMSQNAEQNWIFLKALEFFPLSREKKHHFRLFLVYPPHPMN